MSIPTKTKRWRLFAIAVLSAIFPTTQVVTAQNYVFSATDTQRSVSTAYTVGQSSNNDCGLRIVAGGSAFYTITFGAAGGYAAGCRTIVTNTDTAAGKTLSVNGLTMGGFGDVGCGFGNICPGQSVEYTVIAGSAWALTRGPGHWRPSSGPTLYVSTTGTDTNDCLSSGTACTLSGTCFSHRALIDTSGADVTIQLVDGTYTGSMGASLCSITGNYGASSNSLTFINGNSVTPANTTLNVPVNGVGLFTKDLGEVEIGNVVFTGGAGAEAISGAQFSVVDLLGGITFGAFGANGVHMAFSQSASLNLDASYTISGAAGSAHIALASNANILSAGGNVTIPTALTFTYFAINEGGVILWNHLFTGSGVSGTVGWKYYNYVTPMFGTGTGTACLHTGGTSPNSYFPGSLNFPFPIGSCTDFPISMPYSTLANAACDPNTEGVQYALIDSPTNVWGTNVTSGGGANHVGVYCDGTFYTVMSK